jgi:hypothetical protein
VQKYWLSILLFILTAASFASVYVAVPTAFLVTFLVPGLILSAFFKLEKYELWALVPVFSVLVSTQLVYYVSLGVGYSREIILACFLILTAAYTLVTYRKGEPLTLKSLPKVKFLNKKTLLVFAIIFLIAAVVLLRSVWFANQYGIVITGSNWQDTPLHYEIPESINNGNFPPQVPYFSGIPLTYHYFVDFHTAIVEKTFGFLPQLLPFLNAVFIVIFALSIYALARGHGRRAALISTIIATFGWGFSYVGLFSDLAKGAFTASNNYMYQYGQLFGLPPMFDNLLQQRPLLIGLPAFALVLVLLRNMDDKKRVGLAGLITGLLFPFHAVGFICCFVAFFVSILLNLRRFKLGHLLFLVPSVLALPFIFSSGGAFHLAFSFDFAANFVKENPAVYYLLNLGIPFVIALVSFAKRGNWLLKGTLVFLFLMPNLIVFTPNSWDMYKLFMFAWIPIAVLSGTLLAKARRSLFKILAAAMILLSLFSSVSVVIYNVGTAYTAADWNEYNVGMLVRSMAPERAVFLTYYSIDCPVTMIGGRLRVSSYFNWAYGQGTPYDDIVKRNDNIDRAYTGNETDLRDVVATYNVTYVYVGNEELRNYPGCAERFNNVTWLKSVYAENNLYVYEVNLPSSG